MSIGVSIFNVADWQSNFHLLPLQSIVPLHIQDSFFPKGS
jgi:hypothetical protein